MTNSNSIRVHRNYSLNRLLWLMQIIPNSPFYELENLFPSISNNTPLRQRKLNNLSEKKIVLKQSASEFNGVIPSGVAIWNIGPNGRSYLIENSMDMYMPDETISVHSVGIHAMAYRTFEVLAYISPELFEQFEITRSVNFGDKFFPDRTFNLVFAHTQDTELNSNWYSFVELLSQQNSLLPETKNTDQNDDEEEVPY